MIDRGGAVLLARHSRDKLLAVARNFCVVAAGFVAVNLVFLTAMLYVYGSPVGVDFYEPYLTSAQWTSFRRNLFTAVETVLHPNLASCSASVEGDDLNETLQQLTENQKDLVVQKSRLQETDAALAGIISTRQQTEAEFRRTLFSELNEAERKAGGLADDLSKAERRTKLQLLTAPVDGVVQQLAVHTVGGVVTPAQQLAVIVPADAALEVEAMVSNRDIGFVHPGQEAQVKIDTFNFTRYGLLHGRVMSVSRDAIVRDIPQEAKNDQAKGADTESSEPRGQQYVYSARISLEHTRMQVEDELANLEAGMAVTVEIRTGSRAVISYLLSPLMRYKHDSMRER
jgi:hemolysin D